MFVKYLQAKNLLRQDEYCLFISDCHLCDSRTHITQAFIKFCNEIAVKAHSLFILGDLFEYWAGDDVIETGVHHSTITALKNLSAYGVKVFFMHGNRDFLLDDRFLEATGGTLLNDPSLLNLFNKPVLLSHGDALCTDDIAYQQFRLKVRNESWQKQFLDQPLASRITYIEQIRIKSEDEKSTKTMQIMDVNPDAVESLLRTKNYPPIFIHGHTHRPRKNSILLDGHQIDRWVLGDWYEQGSYLILDAKGCHSLALNQNGAQTL